jgi:hypothetical protein
LEQVSEFGEEFVSDILNPKSFLIANSNLVLIHESLGFDLEGVGVDLPVPEPLRAPELNELGIHRGNVTQVLKKFFSFRAVLNTKSDVGQAVYYIHRAILGLQALEIFSILLTRVKKMPIAALKSETAGKILKAVHDVHNGGINRDIPKRRQGCLPLLKIVGIVYKILGFYECFHLPVPLRLIKLTAFVP